MRDKEPVRVSSNTSIGQCVAVRRQERGLSQRELAFALGVKRSLLKQYENGEAIFTPDVLLKAAQVLEVKPAKFFEILAQKRLAEIMAENLHLESSVSVVDEADKIRFALSDTISKCDSLITILDIIKASKNI